MCVGYLLSSITINFDVSFKPHQVSAFIDALHEFSPVIQSMSSFANIGSLTYVFTRIFCTGVHQPLLDIVHSCPRSASHRTEIPDHGVL